MMGWVGGLAIGLVVGGFITIMILIAVGVAPDVLEAITDTKNAWKEFKEGK